MDDGSTMTWDEELTERFRMLYPHFGVEWCVKNLCLTRGQVRAKASRLGLRARGFSEAWKAEREKHSVRMTGRKRPEQAAVMRANHADGKFPWTEKRRKKLSETKLKWHEENEHPRGATGMKHSAETKQKMSLKSKSAWAYMTPQKLIKRTLKSAHTKIANGTYNNPRVKTSWKGGWREIGGVRKFYRSRWEANYAHYLEWLKSKGEISRWEHEPKTFWFEGVKRGTVSYLPDFLVISNGGAESYHEVKGWMDARSKTKIRRMAKYHPDINLIVIGAKAYNQMLKTVAPMVPGWES